MTNCKVERIDRYKGCLTGLAVGDALGMPLEGLEPGSFIPIGGMVGGGSSGLKPGQWTDDTSMALCLATSLVEKKSFDPIDQLKRYTLWYNEGYMSSIEVCFGIGYATQNALEKFQETHEPYCGSTDPATSGNGSIMRLAPVPLFFADDPVIAVSMSGKSSQTTHASVLAVDACRYLGSLICGCIIGMDKEEILSQEYEPAPEYWVKNPLTSQIEDIRLGSFKRLNPPQIKGSGFVVKSLEAALWTFYNSSSFRDGCLMAVNLGDDADTTGAVYGQLAGAYYGTDEIPNTWKTTIAHSKLIEDLAVNLFRCSALRASETL